MGEGGAGAQQLKTSVKLGEWVAHTTVTVLVLESQETETNRDTWKAYANFTLLTLYG